MTLDSESKGDLHKLFSNFQNEFISCYTMHIDEIGVSKFVLSPCTKLLGYGHFTEKVFKFLKQLECDFRFRFERLTETSMVIEIETCMGCANGLSATVASVLNYTHSYNCDSKIPKIEWSMSAFPDPSVFFLVQD